MKVIFIYCQLKCHILRNEKQIRLDWLSNIPRSEGMLDALEWYCENCGTQLYRETFALDNIETDMPVIFDRYYSDTKKCTCSNCGTVMDAPNKI